MPDHENASEQTSFEILGRMLMNPHDQLEKLLHTYYGYIADLEGSAPEILDMLFVRDAIQSVLEQSTPATEMPGALDSRVYQLDALLWQQRSLFLQVMGEDVLDHARGQQQSLRSHWWWYMDQIQSPIRGAEEVPLPSAYALVSAD